MNPLLLNLLIHYNPVYIFFGLLGAWLIIRRVLADKGATASRGTEIGTSKVVTLPGVSSTQFHASADPALDAEENGVGSTSTSEQGQGQGQGQGHGDERLGTPKIDITGWLRRVAQKDRVMLGWRVGMWAFAILGLLGAYEANLLVWAVVSAVAGALFLVHRESKTPYRYAAPRLFYGLLAIALLHLDNAQANRVMHDSALDAQQAWDRDRVRTTFPERVK